MRIEEFAGYMYIGDQAILVAGPESGDKVPRISDSLELLGFHPDLNQPHFEAYLFTQKKGKDAD